MFCCTRKQQHNGQIVNIICLEQQCIKNKNQLACALCVQQQHKTHSLNTMKRMLPEFLSAHKEKQKYFSMLNMLLNFTVENFGEENNNGENVIIENLVERLVQIMIDLKNKVENNNQEVLKMKQIFKNLNKNNNQNVNSPIKSNIITSEIKKQTKQSSDKNINSPIKSTKSGILGINSNTKSKTQNNNTGSIDTFSHNLKHPYLTLSNDNRTVLKSSHPGHRYAILTSKSLSSEQNELQLKIDSCPSGNIMLGFCHENIIKDKDFINTYGTNQGTYLIGQNGNSQSAISFHHSINMMNRKEIVGWNFSQNDILTLGVNFAEEYFYFKMQKGKNKMQEFTMALLNEENVNKHLIKEFVGNYGLKIIVLLQSVGDQVTLLQS